MPPRDIVLDTNFLLVPFQFKIDVLSEIEYLLEVSHQLVISSGSVKELKKLASKKGKNAIAAKLALKMLDANKERIQIVRSTKNVDDWIVDYSIKTGAIVCTNDSALRKRLKGFRIRMISLMGKAKIGFV